MARVESVSLVDDLTGGEADETVVFSLDGRELEIDLSRAHAEELRSALAPYISAARRATSGRTTNARVSSTPRAGTNREENGRIRAWAVEQGLKIADRGRIPSEVIEAYANRGTAPTPVVETVAAKTPKRRTRKKTDAAA